MLCFWVVLNLGILKVSSKTNAIYFGVAIVNSDIRLTRAVPVLGAERAVPGGGVQTPPLLTRSLDVVAGNGKKRSKARQKSCRKYISHFLPQVKIEVTRGQKGSKSRFLDMHPNFAIYLGNYDSYDESEKRNRKLLKRPICNMSSDLTSGQ